MTSGLASGYDPQTDYPLTDQPENPQMRESVSMWICDDEGRFGFPRMCIEAVADDWLNRGIQANIAFPDGRVLIGAGGYGVAPAPSGDSRYTALNAGPLTFEMIKPLEHWRMTFDGMAYQTSLAEQMAGTMDGPQRHVLIDVDCRMALPPWTPGEKAVQSGDAATTNAVGAVGGQRHEQLFRCTGRFAVEGEGEFAFAGTGLRIRRTGERDIGEFPGHCWMSALFPSGRAFGLMAFPPRRDGTPAYSEAFVVENGVRRYGKVIEAPWLTRFAPGLNDCGVVLQMEDGETIAIAGQTALSTFVAKGNPLFGNWNYGGGPHGVPLPFHQGETLYTWDGEAAYGMMERSLPLDKWEK